MQSINDEIKNLAKELREIRIAIDTRPQAKLGLADDSIDPNSSTVNFSWS